MRDTRYATELFTAEVRECRIERLYVKGTEQVEIRFSWWPNGKFAARPLDLPEDHLLELMPEAIGQQVFTDDFLQKLQTLISGANGR